jgi:hypothetical protein
MIIDKKKIRGLRLEPGDIFAVKGNWPSDFACRRLIEPPTDRFHFGIVWMGTEDGDRVILESQGEGTWLETIIDLLIHIMVKKGAVGQAIAIGCLSMYEGKDVRFFRPVYVDKDRRHHVPAMLACYGRNSYGYDYITKLVFGSLWRWAGIMLKERKIRRLNVIEVPYVTEGKALICTAAPKIGYLLIGEVILPVGVTETPNAYEQAVTDGILEELFLEDENKEDK